jgi:hypothetical protein
MAFDRLGRNRLAGVGALEERAIAGNLGDARDHPIDRHVHLARRLDRSERLRLERVGAAVPEHRLGPREVEDGRRAASERLHPVADRPRQRVTPREPRVVARGAGDPSGARQARIEEERPPELFACGREPVVLGVGNRRRPLELRREGARRDRGGRFPPRRTAVVGASDERHAKDRRERQARESFEAA